MECLLDVVRKASFVHAAICPNITTVAILFVSIVSANVNISVNFCWFPASLSMPDSLVELAFVARSICPNIFSFSVEFAVLVLAFVFVSVNKHFNAEAFFDWLHKSTIIVFLFREFKISLSLLFTVSPFSAVYDFCSWIQVHSSSIFHAFNPLAIVNIAISKFKNACAILFAIEELSFVHMLIRNKLKAFSIFFAFSWLASSPSSHVKFTREMPKNTLVVLIVQSKDNAVFVFFDAKLLVFLVYVDSEDKISGLCKIKKLLLSHIGIWTWRQVWHFYVSHMNLRKDFLLFRVVFLHLLHHSGVVYLAEMRIDILDDWYFAEILQRSVALLNIFWLVATFFSNHPTAFNEIVEIFLLITDSSHQLTLPDFTVKLVLGLFVVGFIRKFYLILDNVIFASHEFELLYAPSSRRLSSLFSDIWIVVHYFARIFQQSFVCTSKKSSLGCAFEAVDRFHLHSWLSIDLSWIFAVEGPFIEFEQGWYWLSFMIDRLYLLDLHISNDLFQPADLIFQLRFLIMLAFLLLLFLHLLDSVDLQNWAFDLQSWLDPGRDGDFSQVIKNYWCFNPLLLLNRWLRNLRNIFFNFRLLNFRQSPFESLHLLLLLFYFL